MSFLNRFREWIASVHPEAPVGPECIELPALGNTAQQPARPLSAPLPSEQSRQSSERNGTHYRPAPKASTRHVTVHPVGVQPWLAGWGVSAWLLLGLGLAVWGIFHMAAAVQWVLVAVFFGFVLTSLLLPAVDALNRVLARGWSVLIAILGFFLIFAGLVTWIVDSVVSQWTSLGAQLSAGINGIFQWVSEVSPVQTTPEQMNQGLQTLISQATRYVQRNAANLAQQAVSQASTVALGITILFLGVFCAIFFMLQGRTMWLWFLNILPASARQRTNDAALAGWHSFSGYARGTIIVAFIDGLMAATLLLLCRVPLAAPLAALVMIGAFIPLIGAPLAMIVAAIIALATRGVVVGIIVLLGIALIGQIEGHILQPLIMGHQVSLHPVTIALGVTAGTFIGGLLGAIVAVPFMSICWEVYKVLRRKPDPPLSRIPLPNMENLEGTAVGNALHAQADRVMNTRARAGAPIVARPAGRQSDSPLPADLVTNKKTMPESEQH